MLSSKITNSFKGSISLIKKRIDFLELTLGLNKSNCPFGSSINSEQVKVDQKVKQAVKEQSKIPAKKSSKTQKSTTKDQPSNKIDVDLFKRIDIRVGKIIEVNDHPQYETVFIQKVDIGTEQPRQIATGVRGKVPKEQVQGLVCVFSNLRKKKVGSEFYSQGMLLCAGVNDYEFLKPPEGSKVGERVWLDVPGFKFQNDEHLKAINQNKYIKRFLQNFKTNQNCEACFMNTNVMTSGGKITVKSMKDTVIS